MQTAFRPVLEPDGHGHAARHFPVRLALRRAGTDRSPTDKIGDVLWANGIEQLGGAGHTRLIDLEESRPGKLHPSGDIAGAVQMRIVDESLPADRRPGFFKIGPHYDEEPVANRVRQRLEFYRIFEGGFRIMDRAGTNDDEEPVAILTVEDPTDCFPCFHNQRGDIVGDRKFGLDGPWGGQCLDFYDVLVVERSIHGRPFSCRSAVA